MINFNQFKDHVVVPTLNSLNPVIPFSEEAVDLLMMTCAHESKGGTYIKQVGGLALGVYQMEETTYTDIWENFIHYRGSLEEKLHRIHHASYWSSESIVTDLKFATAMARVHYYRVKEALPKKGSNESQYLLALARYAKQYYNTIEGKATPRKYLDDYLLWRDQ